MPTSFSAIVAYDQNRLIGRNNQLPWPRLPADFKHFRQVTMGKPIVMGRNTWQSIGRPLPGRTNLILTRHSDFSAEGAHLLHSLDALHEFAQTAEEIVIIGGAQVYQALLPVITTLYITEIQAQFANGDRWFPDWHSPAWQLTARREQAADAENPYPLHFLTWVRSHHNGKKS